MFVASKIYLNGLVDFTNQLFCLIPAQTGVSNRFSKDIWTILATIFQVGFNHKAANIFANVFIPGPIDESLADNADLFQVVFTGIIMVGIDDNERIGEAEALILFDSLDKNIVVVVGFIDTLFGTGDNIKKYNPTFLEELVKLEEWYDLD